MTTDPHQPRPTSASAAAGAAAGAAGTGRPTSGTGSTEAPMPEAEYRARTESIGEMFASFSENLSTLVRQEIALAKAEATVEAKKAGTGAGLLAGAALAAVFVLLFLSMALMWALGSVMHVGWAAVIVAVVWAIVAAMPRRHGQEVLRPDQGPAPDPGDGSGDPADLNPTKGDAMSNNPDEIRADIERTRTSQRRRGRPGREGHPAKAVHRQGDRVRERMTNLKESIMGSPADPYSYRSEPGLGDRAQIWPTTSSTGPRTPCTPFSRPRPGSAPAPAAIRWRPG